MPNSTYLAINGGKPLKGTIIASGAKNAITKLLVASLLSDKKCIFYNVPDIGDVSITLDLCKEVGMQYVWDKKKKILETHTKTLTTTYISQKFSGANRIPILILGALLGRSKEIISVPTLGGDKLGTRALDFHMDSLQKLGAEINFYQKENGAYYEAHAKEGLTGTILTLPYPSVGATENTILASVYAKGSTVIKNAAIEPEIIDLILFLQKLGVNITIDVDRTICLQQTSIFYETEHTVLTDRNEVVSYALAAIATKGDVFIQRAQHQHMISFLNLLREINGGFQITDQGIRFFYQKPLIGNIHIETDVHPGFMTDWQPLFGVLLTQSSGTSIIHETVYENRLGYTAMLKQMGADIQLFKKCLGEKTCRFAKLNHTHSAIIKGITPLQGQIFSIPDLRAGFAYVMAALIASDFSKVYNVDFLDRGYHHLEENLSQLGADITRKSTLKGMLKEKDTV